jgi:hypothetical protein
MNMKQRIAAVATTENAEQYGREQDKFVFCLDLLELSAWGRKAEAAVNELEDEFDRLNNHGMTLADMAEQSDQESAAEKANEYALEGVTNY